MVEPGRILLIFGGLFLVGLLTDLLGSRTFLPRVTLLIIFGVVVGPSGVDLFADIGETWFPIITHTALVMVGFLLGGKLTYDNLKTHGRDVLAMSIGVSVATAGIVTIGLRIFGAPIELALILGAVATATAPAATVDVVRELRAEGPFTDTLLGVVALDDVWGLILFSIVLSIATAMGGALDASGTVLMIGRELGGAFLLGSAVGVPVAYMTGRIHPGEPTLVEALGAVFVCGGIALELNVSLLLSSMVMGAVVANLARHHNRPFHAVEGVEWPFMILFFVFAGAKLELSMLQSAGATTVMYVLFRCAGRIAGSRIGRAGSLIDMRQANRMGIALLPQAGVAIGIGLVGAEAFPELADTLMPTVIAATVVFEIAGPVATRYAITSLGEDHPERAEQESG